MKIITYGRTVVARMACPVCHEPARARPPRMWAPANGPRPSWSHVGGEPLCPVVGADGYRPARHAYVVTARRATRTRRYPSCAFVTRRAWAERVGNRPDRTPPGGDGRYWFEAGEDNPGCDGGEADAVVRLPGGELLCAAEAAVRAITRSARRPVGARPAAGVQIRRRNLDRPARIESIPTRGGSHYP